MDTKQRAVISFGGTRAEGRFCEDQKSAFWDAIGKIRKLPVLGKRSSAKITVRFFDFKGRLLHKRSQKFGERQVEFNLLRFSGDYTSVWIQFAKTVMNYTSH